MSSQSFCTYHNLFNKATEVYGSELQAAELLLLTPFISAIIPFLWGLARFLIDSFLLWQESIVPDIRNAPCSTVCSSITFAIDRIIQHLKLTFASERPPPSQTQPQLPMAAEESAEYLLK